MSVINCSEQSVSIGLRALGLVVVLLLGIFQPLVAREAIRGASVSIDLPTAIDRPKFKVTRGFINSKSIDNKQRIAQADTNSDATESSPAVVRPPRRLLRISVHQGRFPPERAQGRRVFSTQSARLGDAVHVNVLEGETGTVRIGAAVPIVQGGGLDPRYPAGAYLGTGYVEAARGFLVRPEFEGDKVILRIAASGNRLSRRRDGSVEIFESDTVVRGPLGEWLPFAGAQASDSRQQQGSGRRYGTRDFDYPQFWVRAVIPNQGRE